MEQKKLLWISASVGIFLLIIIGAALILYRPNKSGEPVVASVESFGTPYALEPDIWTRSPRADRESPPPDPPLAGYGYPAPDRNGDFFSVPEFEAANVGAINAETINAANLNVDTLDVRSITGRASVPPEADSAGAQNTAEVSSNQSEAAVQAQKTQDTGKKSSALADAGSSAAKKTSSSEPSAQAPKAAAKKSEEKTSPSVEYWIQAAALADKLKAERAREELGKKLITPDIFTREIDGVTYYRVRIGPYSSENEARYWLEQLIKINGFESSYISQVRA